MEISGSGGGMEQITWQHQPWFLHHVQRTNNDGSERKASRLDRPSSWNATVATQG